jgi:hypothetical protein
MVEREEREREEREREERERERRERKKSGQFCLRILQNIKKTSIIHFLTFAASKKPQNTFFSKIGVKSAINCAN